MKEIVCIIIGICVVGVASFLFFFKRNAAKNYPNIKELELLKMEDVIVFFRKKEVLEKLKSNENIIAVAIRENKKDYYEILCTLYDQQKKEILNIDECSLIFKTKNIDKDLKNAFGDKDMIILQ
ncbi:hypothetical protein [uncultured Brachyspira sp.]|uniref:hypothetical protein n=1 Tax=uncultured Brachyspira sp. TaxID=221953 RepID=UPI002631FBCE|nr:hypothetical protein [uncultured Brachyspira sp.]